MTDSILAGTPYETDEDIGHRLTDLADQIGKMRSGGKLDGAVLRHLRKYFRIKSIYHSNAIEGNQLDIGETRLVIEQGMTITGRSLKDQAEARNLSEALDYLEELVSEANRPLTESDIRTLHAFILKGIDDNNAGRYRTVQVEIGGSAYSPTKPESLPAQMAEFGAWLSQASVARPNNLADAIVISAIAHTWFVTIHPFIDGNGRTARLLLNLILMRFGIPIAIITKEDRIRYYDALEESQTSSLGPLLSLVADCIEESLEEYERAAEEQRTDKEWAQSLASKLDERSRVQAQNEYEIWKNAAELFSGHMRNCVDILSENLTYGRAYFKEFDSLPFEKFESLKTYGSAKRTWFFRVDLRRDDQSVRYLFFFGTPSFQMRGHSPVSIFISRETPPDSFFYERLDALTSPDVPTISEVGYDVKSGSFLARHRGGKVVSGKVEALTRQFVTDVIEKGFPH